MLGSRLGRQGLDDADRLHAAQHPAEDDVARVEVRRGGSRDVKLRRVGVAAAVGQQRLRVNQIPAWIRWP